MCMRRHCVPYASRKKFCQSHCQLTALYLSCYDVFVDDSVVGIFQCSKFYLVLVFYDHNAFFCFSLKFNMYCWVRYVCRCTVHVEFCRVRSIFTLERNIFGSSSNIHSVSCIYFINTSVNCDDSISTDIDDSKFSSLKEIFCTKFISCCENQFLIDRNCCSCDDTIDVAVYQIDLICLE